MDLAVARQETRARLAQIEQKIEEIKREIQSRPEGKDNSMLDAHEASAPSAYSVLPGGSFVTPAIRKTADAVKSLKRARNKDVADALSISAAAAAIRLSTAYKLGLIRRVSHGLYEPADNKENGKMTK